jgi:protein-L-isoaspartate(D-aspartate) O-methyltransferase
MSNSSQSKTGLPRFIVPGAIGLIVVLLAVAVFLILPGSTSGKTAAKQNAAVSNKSVTAGSPAKTDSQSSQVAQTTTDGSGSSTPAQAAANPASPPAFDITTRVGQPPLDSEAHYLKWMLANTPEKESYLKAKWERAQAIVARKDATNPRIVEAFLRAPREFFCRTYNMPRAYADAAMPIGFGQTISGPHLVSHMTQALDPQPNQKVLEVGTGSGYQSSVLSELSNHVYTIEIVKQLYEETNAIYTKWSKDYPEYNNIKRKNADGYYGWPQYAPFDRIIVTAGIDHIPPDLLKQLAPGGIMVIPVGPPSGQTVLKITKEVAADGSVTFKREDIYHGMRKVIFVPFTSKNGIHSTATDSSQGK